MYITLKFRQAKDVYNNNSLITRAQNLQIQEKSVPL